MLSKKNKGLFLEVNRFSILVAESSSATPPMTLESLEEFPRDSTAEITQFMESMLAQSKGARYLPANCGVYPVSRFLRRHTVESAAKAKDSGFLNDVMENQLKLDSNKNRSAVLNAVDGLPFDGTKSLANQKELLFCGAEAREFNTIQQELTEYGIFPESIQIGTVSCVAGLMHYLRSQNITTPVMFVEMTPENANLIVMSGQKVDLCRPIPFGFNTMFPLVQQELGLKDEESAKKLFYSDTFDFTEIGASLLRKALKELQASTGFYEVQTGQTISHFLVGQLPENLKWIPQVLSQEIGIQPLKVDFESWLKSSDIEIGESINLENLSARWFGLMSLMLGFDATADGTAKEK